MNKNERKELLIYGQRVTDFRRHYLMANIDSVAIAFAAVLTGITFLLNPGALAHSAAGQTTHPFDYFWNIAYVLGAGLMLIGLWNIHGKTEAVGRILFVTALIINALSLFVLVGIAALPSVSIFVAFAVANHIRLMFIIRGERTRTLFKLAEQGAQHQR